MLTEAIVSYSEKQLQRKSRCFRLISLFLSEAGYLFAYRAGGNLSTTNLLSSSLVVVALLFIGYFAYHDQITAVKVAGIALCTAGIILITK